MLLDNYENYGLRPTKGFYRGLPLTAWVTIPHCAPDDCRVIDLCAYKKTTNPERPVRCGLQRQYMTAITAMIHRCFGEQLMKDEYMLFKVGMHIIPMYLNLCALKMEALSVVHAVDTTHRGDRKADPVYKEIRETIKHINLAWKDIGLRKPSDPVEPRYVPKGVAEGFEDAMFAEPPDKPKLDLGEHHDDN